MEGRLKVTVTDIVIPEMSPARPTPEQIVELIIRDAARHSVDVSWEEAVYVDDMFTCVVGEVRAGKPMYLLTSLDLQVAHTIIETIVPDESQPEPGSAHEALGFRHLREGELYFERTFVGNLDDNTRHCAVTIVTEAAV